MDVTTLGLLGLAGSGVTALFIKHFLLDKRVRLIAETQITPAKVPDAVVKRLQERPEGSFATDPLWIGVRSYITHNTYARVTLRNASTKIVKGAFVTTESQGFAQVDNGPELVDVAKGHIVAGDILPKQERVVHLWLWVIGFGTSFAMMKRLVDVSAHEFDTVRKRYPLPPHLKDRLITRAFLSAATIVGVSYLFLVWRTAKL